MAPLPPLTLTLLAMTALTPLTPLTAATAVPPAATSSTPPVVPLDMAPDSFDDQYRGCGRAMTAALPALNLSEFRRSGHLAEAWALAAAEWRVRTSPRSPRSPLSPAQAIALLAYTAPSPLHRTFNAAVRAAGRSRREYRDNFHFKALHFLLTDALATLKDNQGQKCRCVVWAEDWVQFKAQRGQKVRFGQFALASLCKDIAPDFGRRTVFQVHTCHGVDISELLDYYSEKKVVIPPFETFEVTDVTQDKKGKRIWLNSTGTHSNYNCEWLRGGSGPRDPPLLGGLLLATTALAVASGIL